MDEREARVREITGSMLEPKLKWKIADLQLLRHVRIRNDVLTITIELITEDQELTKQFDSDLRTALAPLGFSKIDLTLNKAHTAGQGIQGIRKIFMVGSGKGGVGKSSIAANIAVTLMQRGYRVGLLDADIYGPSIPHLFNITDLRPRVLADEVLEPVTIQGIKVLSIGNLIPAESAVSWRGQLVSGTILQFVRKTDWGFLDYLIIDMPPGTGDVQLTLASVLKVTGAIMVSMDHQLVIGDVVRSISHLHEKQIPLVGIVNNMTSFCCERCGHEQTIFPGRGRGLDNVKVLAEIPLDREFCLSGNAGSLYMLTNDTGRIHQEFNRLVDVLESFSESQQEENT